MANIAEILVGLEKRIIALEQLAGIKPEATTLVHPKSMKQADFRVAEITREVAELTAANEVVK